MNLSGQAVMIEFVIAILVVILLFLFLQTTWRQNFDRWNAEQVFLRMEDRGHDLADTLVETQGYPPDWNSVGVQIIGLASVKNTLDGNKVALFRQMVQSDYNFTRHQMKFSEYEFWIEIDSENDSLDVNIGKNPGISSSVVSLSRLVSYEKTGTVFRLFVFR